MLLFTFLDESICRFSSFFCPHTSSSARFACLHFTQASCAHYYFWSNSFAVLMNVQKLKEQKARAHCVVGWVHKGQGSPRLEVRQTTWLSLKLCSLVYSLRSLRGFIASSPVHLESWQLIKENSNIWGKFFSECCLSVSLFDIINFKGLCDKYLVMCWPVLVLVRFILSVVLLVSILGWL